MREIVIASAARTAIGTFGGTLATVPAAQLGTVALKAAIERAGIGGDAVDEVIMGCVLQAGQGGRTLRGRQRSGGLACPWRFLP